MTSDNVGSMPFFFPKADAAVLSSRCEAPPAARPQTVWPVFDRKNLDQPLGPWPSDMEKFFYPSKPEPFAAASIPEQPACPSDRYMRAFLARNERLRSSMLWYYTRNILNETELLAGLQEKAFLAQESTDWEFVVIGILDVNYYIRLATVGLPLTIMPRGETICAHVVSEPPGVSFMCDARYFPVRLARLARLANARLDRASFCYQLLWRIGDFGILPTWSLVDFGRTQVCLSDCRTSLETHFVSGRFVFVRKRAKNP